MMKRVLVCAIFAIACIFSGCSDKKDTGSGLQPATNEQLASPMDCPVLPQTKDNKMISWKSTYQQVLDAISDRYDVSETNESSGRFWYITVQGKDGDDMYCQFTFRNSKNGTSPEYITGKDVFHNNIHMPLYVAKDINGVTISYYVYANTIVSSEQAAGGYNVVYFPRTDYYIGVFGL